MQKFIFILTILVICLFTRIENIFPQDDTFEMEKADSITPQEAGESAGSSSTDEQISSGLSSPLLEIRQVKTSKDSYSIELRDVGLVDFFRVLAHDYNLNILIDKDVTGNITASFTNITLEEAMDRIADMFNMVLEKKGNVMILKPNLIIQVFVLKHIEAKSLLNQKGENNYSDSSLNTEGASEDNFQDVRQATIYDLLSKQGKVFLGKQPNSIMVIDYPQNVEKVREYFDMADRRMSAKIFKLKYLSAKELVGETSSSSGGQPNRAINSSSTSSGSTTNTNQGTGQ